MIRHNSSTGRTSSTVSITITVTLTSTISNCGRLVMNDQTITSTSTIRRIEAITDEGL